MRLKQRNLSSLGKNCASSFQSDVITAVVAFPQMTKHVSSYLQKKAHQTNLFYIII